MKTFIEGFLLFYSNFHFNLPLGTQLALSAQALPRRRLPGPPGQPAPAEPAPTAARRPGRARERAPLRPGGGPPGPAQGGGPEPLRPGPAEQQRVRGAPALPAATRRCQHRHGRKRKDEPAAGLRRCLGSNLSMWK